MADLSPQAQAVITASNCAGSRIVQLHIAAALRAAADQLEVTNGECPGVTPFEIGFLKGAARCQRDLLAIAAELEGDNEPTFTPEEVEMIQAPWSYLQSQQELEGGR